jgi:DNA-directed RNA polymerase subunit M/transcription elongation factor TFIIS
MNTQPLKPEYVKEAIRLIKWQNPSYWEYKYEFSELTSGARKSHENVARALQSNAAQIEAPVPMLLFCPVCHAQHIDEPDERTPDWDNPPHRSHLCHSCGCIWRPSDRATTGVAKLNTVGKADTWTPDTLTEQTNG